MSSQEHPQNRTLRRRSRTQGPRAVWLLRLGASPPRKACGGRGLLPTFSTALARAAGTARRPSGPSDPTASPSSWRALRRPRAMPSAPGPCTALGAPGPGPEASQRRCHAIQPPSSSYKTTTYKFCQWEECEQVWLGGVTFTLGAPRLGLLWRDWARPHPMPGWAGSVPVSLCLG